MFQNPKIVLSPTYAYLQQEIRKIPAGDYRILETYCDRRNMVRYAELRQWNPQILCGAVMLRQGVNLPRRIKTGFRSLLSHLGLRK